MHTLYVRPFAVPCREHQVAFASICLTRYFDDHRDVPASDVMIFEFVFEFLDWVAPLWECRDDQDMDWFGFLYSQRESFLMSGGGSV